MGNDEQAVFTTHDAPDKVKDFLKILPKPSTQVGCIPLIRLKEGGTQKEVPSEECYNCRNEQHSILQCQAYIRADAVRNISGTNSLPTNYL